uniref:Uncharacterized protein n=1 Tax=Klebsiella pneumoniae TaxID=573 RepID=A0A8B0SXD1_KLEPN|nr:hypothetical protein [Klebsiella pneumoniae]
MSGDLAAVTDTYGGALSTPREIHQAINSLIFFCIRGCGILCISLICAYSSLSG